MERSHSYSYPYTTTASTAASTSRYSSTHATSSAFSASANPNEDWTKISDLAERRRIQNRIAQVGQPRATPGQKCARWLTTSQRNYRKKLKRRLEDLERRAGSSSASPEQVPQDFPEETTGPSEAERSNGPARQRSKSNRQSTTRQTSPEPLLQEDRASLFGQHSPRQLSASPPPLLSFATYPPADTSFYSTFPSQQLYSTTPQMTYPDYGYSHQYGLSLPPTLPSMLPSHEYKREAMFSDEDILSPFNMNYASMAGMQVPSTHEYWDATVQRKSGVFT